MNLPTEKIKLFFLYLFCLVGLVLTLIGGIQALNLGLKTYIFTKADEQHCPKPYYPIVDRMYDKETPKEEREREDHNRQLCLEERTASRQQDAAQALAFLIVGLPVFTFFYRRTK